MTVDSTVKEIMTKEEYNNLRSQRQQEMVRLEGELDNLKRQLDFINKEVPQETPELLDFAEKVKKANLILNKKQVQERAQQVERTVATFKKEMGDLKTI